MNSLFEKLYKYFLRADKKGWKKTETISINTIKEEYNESVN